MTSILGVSRSAVADRDPGGSAATDDVASGIDAARGGGSTLPDPVRREMEGHLGVDLSAVRVHTGHHAEALDVPAGTRALLIYPPGGRPSVVLAAGAPWRDRSGPPCTGAEGLLVKTPEG